MRRVRAVLPRSDFVLHSMRPICYRCCVHKMRLPYIAGGRRHRDGAEWSFIFARRAKRMTAKSGRARFTRPATLANKQRLLTRLTRSAFFAFGRAVLYLPLYYVFALYERKYVIQI